MSREVGGPLPHRARPVVDSMRAGSMVRRPGHSELDVDEDLGPVNVFSP